MKFLIWSTAILLSIFGILWVLIVPATLYESHLISVGASHDSLSDYLRFFDSLILFPNSSSDWKRENPFISFLLIPIEFAYVLFLFFWIFLGWILPFVGLAILTGLGKKK